MAETPAQTSRGKGKSQRRDALVHLALRTKVLRLGKFRLKSGRSSDYFFNMGAISDAADLKELGRLYAETIAEYWPLSGDEAIEILFGPAYKGIPLAVATALALAGSGGPSLAVAYDRKEVKVQGEGGRLVGADVAGRRVLLLDDVLTAGTAVRSSCEVLRAADAHICGVLVALDRCESAEEGVPNGPSARQLLQQQLGVPVQAIAEAGDIRQGAG